MKTINELSLKLSPVFKKIQTFEGIQGDKVIFDKLEKELENLYLKHNTNIKSLNIEYDVRLDDFNYLFFIDNEKVVDSYIKNDKFIVMDKFLSNLINTQIFKEPVFNLSASYINSSEVRNLLYKGCVVITPEVVIVAHISEYIKNSIESYSTSEIIQNHKVKTKGVKQCLIMR